MQKWPVAWNRLSFIIKALVLEEGGEDNGGNLMMTVSRGGIEHDMVIFIYTEFVSTKWYQNYPEVKNLPQT